MIFQSKHSTWWEPSKKRLLKPRNLKEHSDPS